MTFAGLLAFFGLAVVTMDVLGGVIATGVLLRGGTVRHLLAFAGGYVVIVTAATLVLHPLLELLGRWLHPVLDSNDAIGAVEVVVGLALLGFSVHQFRAASRPPRPHGRLEERASPARLAAAPLALAGVAFAGTALADPAFTIAVGMASQEQHLTLRIGLLVVWNLVYQLPLAAVLLAAALGRHEQLVTRVMELVGPRRQILQTALAALLALAGLAVLGDGLVALAGGHVPWLRQLILLR
jgi:cytochrome c biogenesis protein CcdA